MVRVLEMVLGEVSLQLSVWGLIWPEKSLVAVR